MLAVLVTLAGALGLAQSLNIDVKYGLNDNGLWVEPLRIVVLNWAAVAVQYGIQYRHIHVDQGLVIAP